MSLFASFNDRIITRAEVRIPMFGIFDMDVDVQDGAPASGACVVKIAGLTMKGFVLRGAAWHGVFRARIVGGAGGWSRTIGPSGYRSLTGVKASTVAGDAAREVGETFTIDEDFTVGNFWAREAGPASRILALLDRPWYMRADGVTVMGARATTPIASAFDVIDGSPEQGIYTIATEKPEDFTPGRMFSSAVIPLTTIRGVVHRVDAGHVRTEVWAR